MWNSVGLDLVIEDCARLDALDHTGLLDVAPLELDALYNASFWTKIHSCISTGREANVYYATDDLGNELAIKLYTCRERDLWKRFDFNTKEVEHAGLFFPSCVANECWALSDMKEAGVRCPNPIAALEHVLLEEFIGSNGVPAPTLSVMPLTLDQLLDCYKEIIKMMRTLYQECKRVHGDLSENNMLYHEGHVYLIDASQSLESDHAFASKLLKKDCASVLDFFRRRCISAVTVEELFDFVRGPSILDDSVDRFLEMIQQKAEASWVTALPKRPADALLLEERCVEELKSCVSGIPASVVGTVEGDASGVSPIDLETEVRFTDCSFAGEKAYGL